MVTPTLARAENNIVMIVIVMALVLAQLVLIPWTKLNSMDSVSVT